MRFASKPLALSPSGIMTASLTSDTCDVRTEVGYSIQAVWTGTPTGTLKLQISGDSTSWTDAPSPQSLAGAAGSYIWDVPQTAVGYVRMVYTFTSGTGSLAATFSGKGA